MKNLLVLVFVIIAAPLFAQKKVVGIAGAGRTGLPNSGGSIFVSNPDGSDFKTLKNFVFDPIGEINQDLALGPDGFLYGVSDVMDAGIPCIFFLKIDPDSGVPSILFKFEGFTKALCGPVWGQDGFFYFSGMATNEAEKIIRADLTGQNVKVLATVPSPYSSYQQSFDCFKLKNIAAGVLVMVLPGNRLARVDANSIKVIKQLDESIDGRLECFEAAPNGKLYGTLNKFTPPITFERKLFEINADGSGFGLLNTDPLDFNLGYMADILVADDSSLIMTSFFEYPSSKILKLNLNSKKAQVLYQMPSEADYSWAELVKTSDGNITFTCNKAIWNAKPDGSQLHKIAQLNYSLQHKVIETPGGRLYALNHDYTAQRLLSTALDGSNAVLHYEYNPLPEDGASPANLIKSADGNYYGEARIGGQHKKGYIFSMQPDGSAFSPVLNFTDLDVDFDDASFFEGSDGRLYFGARKLIPDNNGGLTAAYGLFSIDKNGNNLITLCNSYGAATSCIEGMNGKLHWIEGFSLNRMNKDKSGQETGWKKFAVGADLYNQIGRLCLLPNGDIFGGVDYYYDDFCSNTSYSNALSLFLFSNDDFTFKPENMPSKGFIAGKGNEVLSFDYLISSSDFTRTDNGFQICPPSMTGLSFLRAAQLDSDNFLWGQRIYANERFDIVAVNTDNKDCTYTIPWNEQMGYRGKVAFVTGSASTPIHEINTVTNELNVSPNPATDVVMVERASDTGNCRWALIDIRGITLATGSSNDPAFEVPLQGYPAGVYQLTGMEEKSGARFSQKIVKQ